MVRQGCWRGRAEGSKRIFYRDTQFGKANPSLVRLMLLSRSLAGNIAAFSSFLYVSGAIIDCAQLL